MTKTMNNSSRSSTTPRHWRREGVAGAAVLLACCFSSGVAAFSNPTMKVDILGRSIKPMSTEQKVSRPGRGVPAGSPLDMISKDQHDFELSVGHAMDVLRDDYPGILTKNPDFSIYDENLEVIDPSNFHLLGVKNYKGAFRLLHAIVRIFYCPERSSVTFRMCFDKARQNIRISWNAQVIPKAIFGGYKTTLHVDGISVYEISRNSGNITQHRIEKLVINDAFYEPEHGIFAALRGYAEQSDVDQVPVFSVPSSSSVAMSKENQIVRFQNFAPMSRSVLFSSSGDDDNGSVSSTQLSSISSSSSDNLDWEALEKKLDWDALEKKNSLRKKFGLDPLTPEEFTDLQEQIDEMGSQQQKRAASAATELADKKKQEEGGFLKKLFGKALEDTCEDNYDCERPEVCCDFVFKKMCCTSGMRILDGPPQSRVGQPALVPIPVDTGPYPPENPRGNQF